MYILVIDTGLPVKIVKTTNPTAFKLSIAVQVTHTYKVSTFLFELVNLQYVSNYYIRLPR